MSKKKLTFNEAAAKCMDVIDALEEKDTAIEVIGATLSYTLVTYFKPEIHSALLLYLMENTRKYIESVDEEINQEAQGNA